jgi:hypothetical protein
MSEKRQYDIPTPKKEEQDSASSQELKSLGLSGDAIRKANNVIEDNIEPITKLFAFFTKGMIWILTVAIWVIPPKTEVFKSRTQHKPCTSVRGA